MCIVNCGHMGSLASPVDVSFFLQNSLKNVYKTRSPKMNLHLILCLFFFFLGTWRPIVNFYDLHLKKSWPKFEQWFCAMDQIDALEDYQPVPHELQKLAQRSRASPSLPGVLQLQKTA